MDGWTKKDRLTEESWVVDEGKQNKPEQRLALALTCGCVFCCGGRQAFTREPGNDLPNDHMYAWKGGTYDRWGWGLLSSCKSSPKSTVREAS